MNTIKFNNVSMEVTSYNKNTYFAFDSGEQVITQDNANCNVVTSDLTALRALGEDVITSIEIYHDENLIYSLHEIECHITGINEYLNEESVSITLSLTFV